MVGISTILFRNHLANGMLWIGFGALLLVTFTFRPRAGDLSPPGNVIAGILILAMFTVFILYVFVVNRMNGR